MILVMRELMIHVRRVLMIKSQVFLILRIETMNVGVERWISNVSFLSERIGRQVIWIRKLIEWTISVMSGLKFREERIDGIVVEVILFLIRVEVLSRLIEVIVDNGCIEMKIIPASLNWSVLIGQVLNKVEVFFLWNIMELAVAPRKIIRV